MSRLNYDIMSKEMQIELLNQPIEMLETEQQFIEYGSESWEDHSETIGGYMDQLDALEND